MAETPIMRYTALSIIAAAAFAAASPAVSAQEVQGWYMSLLARPIPDDAISRVSALPPDDPRRIAVHAFLRARAGQSKSQDNT
jgi:hypothetical protein